MQEFVEFINSLSLTGYILIGLIVLILINLKKIITLRSPLDSWQHKLWKDTGGAGEKAEHLDPKDKEIQIDPECAGLWLWECAQVTIYYNVCGRD